MWCGVQCVVEWWYEFIQAVKATTCCRTHPGWLSSEAGEVDEGAAASDAEDGGGCGC